MLNEKQPEPVPDLEQLFARACGLPPGEREALLRDLSQDGSGLAAELRRLLAADSRAGSFLERPAELAHGVLALGDLPEARSQGLQSPGERWVGRELGPYEILQHLGRGGMGDVFEAREARPARSVALKVVASEPGGAGGLARRFEAEADTLARLDHPNVARVFGAGSARLDGEEFAWMAVELIERPLHLTAFADARRLGLQQRVRLFVPVVEALHHAHRKGVLHRDIKPANVLVSAAGEGLPKLIDFGLARWLEPVGPGATERTREGELLGTLHYMSPEQADGDRARIDVRSDVYGLGVVLYELLCGALPYPLEGRSILATLEAIRSAPVRDPRELRPEIDADLAAILHMALHKLPEERYESAGELARDLRAWLDREPIRARRPSPLHRARLFARRHRRLSLGLAAGALLALAAAVWIGSQQLEIRRELDRRLLAERAADDERAVTAAAREELSGLQGVLDGLLTDRFLPALLQDAVEAQANAADDSARRAAVRDAVQELELLADRLAGDPSSDAELARAFVKVGDLMGREWMARAEDVEQSVPAYEAAAAAWRRVLEQRPGDERARSALQAVLGELAQALRKLTAGEEPTPRTLEVRERSRRVAEEAVSIGRSRLAAAPGDIDAAIALNDSLQCLSAVHISLPPYERGGQLSREALELLEGCFERAPEHPRLARALAWANFTEAIWAGFRPGEEREAAHLAARSHELIRGVIANQLASGEVQARADSELEGALEFLIWNDVAYSFELGDTARAELLERVARTVEQVERHAFGPRVLGLCLPYAALLLQEAEPERRAERAAQLERLVVRLEAASGGAVAGELADRLQRFVWLGAGGRTALLQRLGLAAEHSGADSRDS